MLRFGVGLRLELELGLMKRTIEKSSKTKL